MTDQVRQRLDEWRRRLADPRRFHPLLCAPGGDDSPVVEQPWFDEVFASLHLERQTWTITTTPGRPRPHELTLRIPGRRDGDAGLSNLARRAQAAREEAAAPALHLAIGTLAFGADDEARRSPLILLPVDLRRDGRSGPFALRCGAEGPALNPALALFLESPERRIPDPPADWRTTPPSAYLALLAHAFAGEAFRVIPEARLVLFPLGHLLLARELGAREETVLRHPVVRALAGDVDPTLLSGEAPEPAHLDRQDPRRERCVLDADGAQLAVLEVVRRGRLLTLVEGPPGTGKTQTAANLLAESAAAGQRALFVSPKLAALESARRRLEGAQERAAAVLTDAEYDRLARIRLGLAEYARALLEPRWPLERSVADVLAELAGLHAAPRVDWVPPAADLLTPEALEETLGLASAIAPLWDAALAEDSPWVRCIDERPDAAAREEWSAGLAEAAGAVRELKEAAAILARSRGLPAPASPGEVARVLEIEALLGGDPPLDWRWLTEVDLVAARAEAETWRDEMEARRSAVAGLETAFLPDVFDLPEASLEELESAVQRAEALTGRDVAMLLDAAAPLARWVDQALAAAPTWKMQAGRLASLLRLRSFRPTMDDSFRLARAALLLTRWQEPRPRWLDRRVCERVEAALEELDGVYADYRERRSQLTATYRESVIDVDVNEMARRFEALPEGALRSLSPSYHRDRSRLRAFRHDGEPPENPRGDLAKIAAFKRAVDRVAAVRKKHEELLGGLDPGPDGSFDAAREALTVARQVLDQVKEASELEAFGEFLAGPGVPAEVAIVASDLEASVAAIRRQMAALGGVLPPGPVPDKGEGLGSLPFGRLEAWLDEVRAALGDLTFQLDRLRAMARPPLGEALGYEDAREALARLATARRVERKLAEQAHHLRHSYGAAFDGIRTDWAALIAALDRAEEVRRRFAAGAFPEALLARVRTSEDIADAERCASLLRRFHGSAARLARGFEQGHASRRYPLDEAEPWAVLEQRLETLAARLDERLAGAELCRAVHGFEERDLGGLLAALRARRVPSEALRDAVRRALLSGWYESQRADSAVLAEFRREDHEARIAEFRALDRWQWEQGGGNGEEERPERLLAFAGPASVPQLLPAAAAFDLVVFDEASRIPVEEAVAALTRGARVVVFGDTHQLPPPGSTEEAAGGPRSLLEALVAAGIPSLALGWHYRSRHESLAAFPCAEFYGSGFVTQPSVLGGDGARGLQIEHVAGGVQDDTGANAVEAGRVAALVAEHLRERPDRTLGVIVFGEAQLAAVRAAVEAMLERHPYLAERLRDDLLDGFFVKDAEDVQGDERDTILVSLGLGRGALRLDAGPLSAPGGRGKLNVALTRARERLVIVTSLRASEIAEPAPEGLAALARCLEFAEAGAPTRSPAGEPGGGAGSRLAEDVAAAVRGLGYPVEKPLLRSPLDLVVARPGEPARPLLAVQCDDAADFWWATVRDRDRLRQEIAASRGWRIHRVWSPDWATARAAEVERLRRTLEAAGAEAAAPEARRLEGVLPYVVVDLGEVRLPHRSFHDPRNREALAMLFREVAAVEGPVHRDLAARRVLAACSVGRRNARVTHALEHALALALERGWVAAGGSFLRRPGEPRAAAARAPGPEDEATRREAAHLPEDEIALAALALLRSAHALERRKLLDRLGEVFGLAPVRGRVLARFELALEAEVEAGRLVREGKVFRLPRG